MTTFINLLTLSRIFLAAIIFLLLTSSDGYLTALILFFIAGITEKEKYNYHLANRLFMIDLH